MASVPIKFRCYRCNQMIGVSRTKAGAVVACPKCQVDIVVPEPDDSAERLAVTSSTGSTDGGLSLDQLDFRPEDIRAEPGSQFAAFPLPPTAAEVAFEPVASPEVVTDAVETPFRIVETPIPFERAMSPPPVQASPPPIAPARSLIPPRPPEFARGMPAIEIDDAPTLSRSQRIIPQVRSRDLVLPRSVVASWSLFVIVALALAFMAGLLAGHYVWRVH